MHREWLSCKTWHFYAGLDSKSHLHDSYSVFLEFLTFYRQDISITFLFFNLMLLNCAHYLEFLANDFSKAHVVS